MSSDSHSVPQLLLVAQTQLALVVDLSPTIVYLLVYTITPASLVQVYALLRFLSWFSHDYKRPKYTFKRIEKRVLVSYC